MSGFELPSTISAASVTDWLKLTGGPGLHSMSPARRHEKNRELVAEMEFLFSTANLFKLKKDFHTGLVL